MEIEQQTKTIEEEVLEEMMKAGVHYGVSKRYTHPLMKIYLLKTKRNIEFFDLRITLEKLKEAIDFLKTNLKEGKTILFVGVTPAAQLKIQELATALNQPYINFKWVSGFLTNFEVIKARLLYFRELLKKEETGELNTYIPYERKRLEQELQKLKNLYSGVINLEKLPDVVFVVNLAFPQHLICKKEALRKNIPVVSLSSSDNDVRGVKIVIPGNDRAPRSISFVIDYLKNNLIEGQ